MVTSLKGEYGFLKSSSRREQIFFHYDSIHLVPDDDGGDGKDNLVPVQNCRPGSDPRTSLRCADSLLPAALVLPFLLLDSPSPY